MMARKRSKPQPNDDSDINKDDDELRSSLIIVPDEDKEVDYEILDRKYPIIEWKYEYLTTKPQTDESKGVEEVNLNMVVRSNGQRRYFSTLMRVLSVLDREDLKAIYQLVMNRYLYDIPEVCWKLHSSSGVHNLMTETGLVIHMLVENKYPLRKEILSQMLELKLESEEDNFGKDKTNPLTVGSLLKTIRFSIHLVIYNEELAILEQMATSKGISNPLMAGNLPKTTKLT
ncbi:hypothetical protein Tco_0651975 [Tanacetum coccineum]|uniref:Uncharacterized protein n=1 Tax=Tanacetum coccineum TaxID=301880 RepID=A0ABQ4WW97_9ASTR